MRTCVYMINYDIYILSNIKGTVETAIEDHPLAGGQGVFCEMRAARTCHCKGNSFLLLEFKVEAFFKQSQRACSCITWYLTSMQFMFNFYTKGGSKLAQAYNKVHV